MINSSYKEKQKATKHLPIKESAGEIDSIIPKNKEANGFSTITQEDKSESKSKEAKNQQFLS